MPWFAHLSAGIILWRYFKLDPIPAIIGAVFWPHLFLLDKIINYTIFPHDYRAHFWHTPIWGLLGFVIFELIKSGWGLPLLAGHLSHMLLDTLDAAGIMWLYPFSKKFYGLGLWADYHRSGFTNDFLGYLSDPEAEAVELIMAIIAISGFFS